MTPESFDLDDQLGVVMGSKLAGDLCLVIIRYSGEIADFSGTLGLRL